MMRDSQNFINNKALIDKWFSSVDLPNNEVVIEIGGGKGIITDELIRRFENVTVIEYDKKLSEGLKERYKNNTIVQVLNEDFLSYHLPKASFSIISNIPFNLTSDIIRKITDKNSNLNKAYLIMQKKAILKFVNDTKDGETSLLSNLIQTNFGIEYLFDIGKENFSPRPKFDAGFVVFSKKVVPEFVNKDEEIIFRDFICYLFDRARPLVFGALSEVLPKSVASQMLDKLKIRKDQRIKAVKFEDWINIYKNINFKTNGKIFNLIRNSYSKLLNKQATLPKVNRTRKF